MDTSKQLGAKRLYRFGSIEGKLVIHLAAPEVTALTLCLEDWFDLSAKINSGTARSSRLQRLCARSWRQ